MNIVPVILAQSQEEFIEKVHNDEVKKLAPLFQIDILDGSLFNTTCWADIEIIKTLDHLPNFELHLMIDNPLPVIKMWKENIPSLQRAIIHAEIHRPLGAVIDQIKLLNLEVGIAVNPETDLMSVKNQIEDVDILLIMGVHPGASGQSFLGEFILKKIQNARAHFPNINIAVDGGITLENVKSIIDAGTNQLCVSSAIWKAKNPTEAIKQLTI